MKSRYYSTQWPLEPGAFPKPADNPITDICCFDEPKFIPEIGSFAWGYLEYEKPLSEHEAAEYKLTVSPQRCFILVSHDYAGNTKFSAFWNEEDAKKEMEAEAQAAMAALKSGYKPTIKRDVFNNPTVFAKVNGDIYYEWLLESATIK